MYNPIIIKHFSNPLNLGELDVKDMEIHVGNPVCDDRVMMHIKLDDDNRIADVKYKVYGCATSIATASIFSEFIKMKSVDEVLQVSDDERNGMLGELEPNQCHCIEILSQLFEGFEKK